MADAGVTWPSPLILAVYSELVNQRHPWLHGAFGFMDGLSLPVSVSANPEVEKSITMDGCTHKISTTSLFLRHMMRFTIICIDLMVINTAFIGTIIAAKLNDPDRQRVQQGTSNSELQPAYMYFKRPSTCPQRVLDHLEPRRVISSGVCILTISSA